MRYDCPSVCLSVCLFVCLSPKCKNAIFSKTKQFRAMVSIDDLESRKWAFQKTHDWTPKIQDGGDPSSWKSTWRHLLPRDLDKISQTDISTAAIWSKSKPEVEFQYGGRLGEFEGMSFQGHVPHCGVKEFHPPYWKSFFAVFYYFFVFLMQFGLWRAAAFVSSSIHLLYSVPGQSSRRALRESPSARPLMRDRGSPPPARDSAVQIFPQKLHAKQVGETWMANTVSPRRYQYALATDEQTNEHTNKDIAIV